MGLAREDAWAPGTDERLPAPLVARIRAPAEAPSTAIARILDRVAAGETPGRSRHRGAVRGPRARFRRGVPGRRPAAGLARRRCRHLRRQPQHQLHQHLHLRLQVLRLLQGPAQPRPSRRALRSRPRRDRAPHGGGLAARRHRGVPAGRHRPALHRRDLSCDRRRREIRRARHPRARVLAARGAARRGDAGALALRLSLARARRRGSRACPARQPRSSTTRCARSSAPTSSPPTNGWR